jgi:hypothetical protein
VENIGSFGKLEIIELDQDFLNNGAFFMLDNQEI